MKFIVEVEDFWLHQEDELEPRLTEHIINSVVTRINKSIEDKVSDQIERTSKNTIEKGIGKKIQKLIDDVISTESIPYEKSYNNKVSVPIREYIRLQFEKSSGWASPKDQLEKLAKQFSSEMKNRYDMLFASQIVIKMNEQGLLKDGVAESLIEGNKPKQS